LAITGEVSAGGGAASRRLWGWAALAVVVLLAGALRLAHLGAVVSDPFYDGAVRSMTLSWHNFFFGAVEPSGAVAIDKPPVDLWLQVASVQLFGWGSATLKLPEALAGTLAVGLLFESVRRVFGVRAGLAAGLALAVLPIAVITARSDTMDAVMMALTVLALLCAVRAAERGRTAWLLAAALALGIAFNVKLLESLPALPALVLLAWLGLPGSRRRRLGQLALAGAVYVLVALAWLLGTLLYPAHERPYAYGSSNGSAWNAAFVFNGLDRLEGKAVEGPQQGYVAGRRYPQRTLAEREQIPIVPPSATRLLARVGPLAGDRLGLEALAGLLLGAALLGGLLWERRRGTAQAPAAANAPPQRLRLALAAALLTWLVIGVALFSDMARLHPRYTEALVPAVAGTLGVGVAWASEARSRLRLAALATTLLIVVAYAEHLLFGASALWWLVAVAGVAAVVLAARGLAPAAFALALLCVLAIPLSAALRAVRLNVSDTNRLGVLHHGELAPLSAYLRAHQGAAYYEAAFDSGTKMGELVVRDARPILVLSTLNGRVFTPLGRLQALAASGRVRYAFLTALCGSHHEAGDPDCTPAALWVQRHGVDVSRAAGMPRTGMLWRLP
jgi:4-amino-4-deoxy-L-arabinose transferase-like glycosyltransferase